jgi:hypothetical protein
MAARKVTFISILEKENSEEGALTRTEGFFEYWGQISRYHIENVNNFQIPIYSVFPIGIVRDEEGNVFSCYPEDIKFMND